MNEEEFNRLELRKEPTLESLFPNIEGEAWKIFKHEVIYNPLFKEDPIRVFVDVDETTKKRYAVISDGYQRYRVYKENGRNDYDIPRVELKGVNNVRQALEYSWTHNALRRQLNNYQLATAALKYYSLTSLNSTEKEIATAIGLNKDILNKVSIVNKKLGVQDATLSEGYEQSVITDSLREEMLKDLNTGKLGIREAWNQLKEATDVDNAIDLIEDKAFQEYMKVKYGNQKYKKNAFKKLQIDIYNHEHPMTEECKKNAEYHQDLKELLIGLQRLENKHNEKVILVDVASKEKWLDVISYIQENLMRNKKVYSLAIVELPKEVTEQFYKEAEPYVDKIDAKEYNNKQKAKARQEYEETLQYQKLTPEEIASKLTEYDNVNR